MKSLILSILCCAFFVTGCVTPPPPPAHPIVTSRVFQGVRGNVWQGLVETVALKYPVKAIEKESGLLTTDFVALPAGYNNSAMRKWVNPPSVFLGTWAGLRMNLSILVTEPTPGKVSVNVQTHYEALENNVLKSWVVCQSNGSLENQILDEIGQKLNDPSSDENLEDRLMDRRRDYNANPQDCGGAENSGSHVSPGDLFF